jgi:hypothetical protein
MNTAAEYRRNAAECREMMNLLTNADDKKTLEEMADIWEKLAAQRERDLIPDPEDA